MACESDDLSTLTTNVFKDAKEEDLMGTWAIHLVKNNGVLAEVPATIEACGRDFFIYNKDVYEEFLFQESVNCTPVKSKYVWELNNGIISVSNQDESDELIINKLTKNEFVFSVDIDINNKTETFTFTAYKYTPPNELDLYTSSFSRQEPYYTTVNFKWNKYTGYNTFEKYEIYRSNDQNCNIENAELIKTITDINTNTFKDDTLPVSNNSCYYLKLYTNKGLLGESKPVPVDFSQINPEKIKFTEHSVSTNNDVNLSWSKYTGNYFSHYEISVRDKDERIASKVIATIDDIETTNYIDTDHPIASELTYSITVYNIFGNAGTTDRIENIIKVNLDYVEILDHKSIRFLCIDSSEQELFLYARNNNQYELVKYDYINNQITAQSYKIPTTSTDVEMKLVNSTKYGKELFFIQSTNIWVYNANDLTYKYSLSVKAPYIQNPDFNSSISVNSIGYLGNDLWAISDDDLIATFKRNNDELIYVDQDVHFPDHQGSYNYEVTVLNQSNVLVSHNNEGRAVHYNIDNQGLITNNGIVQVPLLATLNSDISVNTQKSYILNKKRNSIYSSTNFSKIADYNSPLTTFSMNETGKFIYGTNNNSSAYSYEIEDTYTKGIIVYNTETQNTTNITTKGYPLYVFEDINKNIISLSSSFARKSYDESSSYFELFIEVLK